MTKLLLVLIGKRFKVSVGGEFERTCDFMGLMKLLADYSDFFQYSSLEKREYLFRLAKRFGYARIDSNIFVEII